MFWDYDDKKPHTAWLKSKGAKFQNKKAFEIAEKIAFLAFQDIQALRGQISEMSTGTAPATVSDTRQPDMVILAEVLALISQWRDTWTMTTLDLEDEVRKL